MKRVLLIAILIAFGGSGSAFDARTEASVQQPKKADNYTIQRLMLYNKTGKLLMEKNSYGWMTPAIRSNENLSLKEGLNGLAKKIGFEISPPSLRGLFTYKFEGLDDHIGLISYRTHYAATVKSGQLIQPPQNTSRYEWLTPKQAVDSISHPALKAELSQMTGYPKTLWGGSFLCLFKNDKLESARQTEAFYPLH